MEKKVDFRKVVLIIMDENWFNNGTVPTKISENKINLKNENGNDVVHLARWAK